MTTMTTTRTMRPRWLRRASEPATAACIARCCCRPIDRPHGAAAFQLPTPTPSVALAHSHQSQSLSRSSSSFFVVATSSVALSFLYREQRCSVGSREHTNTRPLPPLMSLSPQAARSHHAMTVHLSRERLGSVFSMRLARASEPTSERTRVASTSGAATSSIGRSDIWIAWRAHSSCVFWRLASVSVAKRCLRNSRLAMSSAVRICFR